MSEENEKKTSPLSMNVGSFSMLGFTLAALWGHLTFNGDLPWGTMLTVWLVITMPVAVLAAWKSRTDPRWDGWLGVGLLFITSALGALSGILIGS